MKDEFYYVDVEIPKQSKPSALTTFKVYSENWIESNEKSLSPKTASRYYALLQRINAGIGHIPLYKIDPHHLKEFYQKLRQPGTNMKTGQAPVGEDDTTPS